MPQLVGSLSSLQDPARVYASEKAFTVRVAGLPVSVLERLRCHHTAAVISETLALEEWLATEAGDLCDRLYQAIGALADPALKSRLVSLRRALHNGRRPPLRVFLPEVRAALPPGLATRIDDWTVRLNARDSAVDRLGGQLADEIVTTTDALAGILTDRGLRLAIEHSSPQADDDVRRWLSAPVQRPTARTTTRMAMYISRAAAKTSPLTLFTSSGLGRWCAGGPAVVLRDPSPRRVVEANLLVVQELIGALASRATYAARMLVRVNPTATPTSDRVFFVPPGPMGLPRSLRRSPAVDAILHHLDPGGTLEDLKHALAQASPETDPARLAQFVDSLVESGVLELHLPIPDQELAAASVLTWLDGLDNHLDENLDALRTGLRTFSEHVRGYATCRELEQRRHHRSGTETTIEHLRRTAAGTEVPALPATTPLLFENAVLPGETTLADHDAWAPALADLAAVARFGELIDPLRTIRLLMPAYLKERYGTGARVPLLCFLADHEAELRAGSRPTTPLVAAGELRPLAALARTFTDLWDDEARKRKATQGDALRRLGGFQRAAFDLFLEAPDRDVLQVCAPDLLRTVTQAAIPAPPGPQSLACFVQPYLDHGSPRLVFNSMRLGFGGVSTRVKHLIRKAFGHHAVAEPSEQLRRPGDTPTFVEFESAFGVALSQRDAAFPHVLTYAGTMSSRDVARQVPPAELVVVHDPQAERARLEWTRNGQEVVPLHLGMVAPLFLPPLPLLLVAAFGRGTEGFLPSLLTWPGVAFHEQAQRVRSWPRIDVGSVTMRRRGWWVPPEEVPVRSEREDDAAYLLRLARWRRRNGLPRACFIRVLGSDVRAVFSNPQQSDDASWSGTDSGEGGGRVLAAWMSKARKPVYIDFDSWHLVRAFERLVREPGAALVIEETLPRFEDIPPTEGGGRRAVEWVVDVAGGEPS